MNNLFRIRRGGRQAVAWGMESWKFDYVVAGQVWEAQQLTEKALAERDDDERFFKLILEHAREEGTDQIDEANRFIQDICSLSIYIHGLLRDLIVAFGKLGHQIERADDLDQATEDYKKWMEDYPDLLAIGYKPVQKALRERIAQALGSSPKESNWRELFAGEEISPTGP